MDQRRTTQPGFYIGSSRERGKGTVLLKLVICDDEGKTTTVPLLRDEITIGRGEGNAIRLTERNVSRKHAILRRGDRGYVIEDLKSSNGIRINGLRMEGSRVLRIGDEIFLGDYRILMRAEPSAGAHPGSGKVPSRRDSHSGSGSVNVESTSGTHAIDPAPTGDIIQVDVAEDLTPALVPSPRISSATISQVALADPQGVDELASEKTQETQYARLVMLNAPAPGAEFILTKSSTCLGRFEESDIWVNHPSISREHARIIRDGDEYRVSDIGSANGIRVNRKRTSKGILKAGDEIELGEVCFRYVAPGEKFILSPSVSAVLGAERVGQGPWYTRKYVQISIAALLLLAVPTAYFLSKPTDKTVTNQEVAENMVPVEERSKKPAKVLGKNENIEVPGVPPGTTFSEALQRCETAVRAGDTDIAIAHGEYALLLKPGHLRAETCKNRAFRKLKENQIFARGAKAADTGDQIAAYFAFEELPRESEYRRHPKVASAMEAFATYHLRLARQALQQDAGEASRHVDMVLAMVTPPVKHKREATRIQRKATRKQQLALATPSKKKFVASKTSGAEPSEGRGGGSTKGSQKAKSSPGSLPDTKAKADPACSPIRPDYSECIVRTLRNKARRPSELSLLIESYRQLGKTSEAKASMRKFIDRYPTHRLAAHYQRILLRM